MNEFEIIERFFSGISPVRNEVIVGIGDDAACLEVPEGKQLAVSTDTLVEGVHFLADQNPFDIAARTVAVNLSDLAAAGAEPCACLLALTIPKADETWLTRYSAGLKDALHRYNLALMGGNLSSGPLSMTMTVHGFVPKGKMIRRSGGKPGDGIYVTGELGKNAAIPALPPLTPTPRIDFIETLQKFATAAIDISDGLAADLHHLCTASQVGAYLDLDAIPTKSLDFALHGGDDYELCLTVSPEQDAAFQTHLKNTGLKAYRIGTLQPGDSINVPAHGYRHF